MTVQKLTRSTSKEEFRVFKQALQPKPNPGWMDLRLRDPMVYQPTSGDPRNPAISRGQVALVADEIAERDSGSSGGGDRQGYVAGADAGTGRTGAGTAGVRRISTKVKPEVTDDGRHSPSTTVVMAVTQHGRVEETPTDGVAVGVSAELSSGGGGGEGGGKGEVDGGAVPVSPPSSPTYVATLAEGSEPATADMAEANPIAESGKIQRLPAGGGDPVPDSQAERPVTPPPSSMVSLPAAGDTAHVMESVTGTGGTGQRASGPLRLGRGRKLCPNCRVTTKSAVKQCRECKHIFSPASSRLRPAPRLQPKENEDVITSRRRLRPSQRLMEYECDPVGPSPASGGTVPHGGPGARRPLTTSSPANGGGGANHIAASGAGGGRPAAADGAVAKKSASGSSSRGSESVADGRTPSTKRTNKRKPCPLPGESLSKRKKGGARTVDAAVEARTDRTPSNLSSGMTPTSATAPADRVVGSRNLVVPAGPTVVPPATTVTRRSSDAVHLGSAADDGERPSTTSHQQPHPLRQQYVASQHQRQEHHQHQQQQQHQQMVPASRLPDLAASSTSAPGLPGLVLPSPSQARDVIDLSEASQRKDPFEGVELWWADEQQDLGAGVGAGTGAAGRTSPPTSAFTAVGGASTGGVLAGGGELAGQRSDLAGDRVELLGDGDLMWSPIRSTSVDSTSSLWQDSLAHAGTGASCMPSSSTSLRSSPAPPDFERVAALASAATTGTVETLPRGMSALSNASNSGGSVDFNGLLGDGSSLASFALELPDYEGDAVTNRFVGAVPDIHADTVTSSAGGGGWNTAAALPTVGGTGIVMNSTSCLGTSREVSPYQEPPGGYSLSSTVVTLGPGSFPRAVAS